MIGFTYNGIHSSELGILYVPDASDMGDFFSDYDVIDSDNSWHDGGVYFKSRVQKKSFAIPCFYDRVTAETVEKIIRWLDRRTSGELIFDDRPYVSYFVRPTKKIEVNHYIQSTEGKQLYSGTFTAVFTAYKPFGRLIYTSLDQFESDRFKYETGVLSGASSLVQGNTENTQWLVYNPGTERAHSRIIIKGDVPNTITLTNHANDTVCTIKGGFTQEVGESIEIDSYSGRTEKVTTAGRALCSEFHDDGFLVFEPCTPFYRDISVYMEAEERTLVSETDVFLPSMVGQWVYVDGSWRYISSVSNPRELVMNIPAEETKTDVASIGTQNLVTLSSGTAAQEVLNDSSTREPVPLSIEIKCFPEVR